MPIKHPVKIRSAVIQGTVPVIFFKEAETFIAYTPALDFSTCGNTYEQTRRRFAEALDIFFEECIKHGTLEEALQSYGWQKVSRPSPHWVPPLVVGHAEYPIHISVPAHA